jgi:hypothetical protein
MVTENEVCVKKCWMPGGFCWKNVWHWAFALAVLPFAVKGVAVLVNAVHTVVDILASK